MDIADATIEQLEEEIKMRKDYESKNILLALTTILNNANKKGIRLFNSDNESYIEDFILDHGTLYYKEKYV